SAVWRQFHTAGSARFERAKRIVKPEINSLIQPASDIGVVVFNKHDGMFEFGFTRFIVNLLNKPLSRFIFWVRLPRENKLNRTFGFLPQPQKSFLLTEEQSTALICREAPRKTDRQNLGIQDAVNLSQLLGRFSNPDALAPQSVANEIDQASL